MRAHERFERSLLVVLVLVLVRRRRQGPGGAGTGAAHPTCLKLPAAADHNTDCGCCGALGTARCGSLILLKFTDASGHTGTTLDS